MRKRVERRVKFPNRSTLKRTYLNATQCHTFSGEISHSDCPSLSTTSSDVAVLLQILDKDEAIFQPLCDLLINTIF